ncbi:periplasmic heavy metal sensor [Mycobacterium sp. KBS0706]|uniref:periplasmic heavy metal sensor n=1 Tax=Mycobacterium sp. KBS0706 TaxID=2578109 RepID=UPI00163D4510|nr:periplasmic heavy metal sensor [Mycobacterium sp. KBS0706]
MTARSWRWALVASLALNLLLLGVLGTWLWRSDSRSGPSALSEAVATLPEPDRTTLAQLLEQRRAQSKAIGDELRQQRAAVNEALSAEPYDPDKVAAALAAMSDEFKELRGVVQGTILEIMPKLSAEQRRKMLERRDALWRL